MTNLFSKFALTTVGLAVGLVIADVSPVQAAIVGYTFDITIDSGLLIPNTYSGTFSYDDGTLDLTDFTFSFQGQNYDEGDDPFATVEFDGNTFLGLNYSVATVPSFSFVPGFPGFLEPFFAYDLQPGSDGQGGTGTILYARVGAPQKVPEGTSTASLLLIAAVGLGTKLASNKNTRNQ